MKKVLAIFMAIAMFVTMFSFSVVAFAEGETEAEALNKYLGTASVKNFGLKYDRKLGVVADDTQGGLSKPWNLNVFNPDTAIEDAKISAVQPTVGTTIIDKVNGYAASGEYSEVVLNLTASAEEAILFYGLKGTEETPIVIVTDVNSVAKKTFASKSEAAAISLVDCEYVTVKNLAVSSISNGIFVEGSSDITIEAVDFTDVGFTDYLKPIAVTDEEGNPVMNEDGTPAETFAEMDTTALADKGSAVYVGTGCDGVTVTACTFSKCRAGVVADSSVLEEGDVASTGVAVLGCTFSEISDAAVYVDGADDVVVADGSVTKSGTLSNAIDWDGSLAVAFYANNAKNITIEKIYSTDNAYFLEAYDTTGRVRYCVSDRDSGTYVVAPELLVYNNTFVTGANIDLTATVRNNIFAMVIGEKALVSDGDNNCYYWTSKGDRGSIRKNPRFANAYDGSVEGTSVRDNYILATGSPCIGAGEKVEDDMGTTDFYGNAIGESFNIGAYAGEGAEATVEIASDFVDFFNYIIAVIKNFLGLL